MCRVCAKFHAIHEELENVLPKRGVIGMNRCDGWMMVLADRQVVVACNRYVAGDFEAIFECSLHKSYGKGIIKAENSFWFVFRSFEVVVGCLSLGKVVVGGVLPNDLHAVVFCVVGEAVATELRFHFVAWAENDSKSFVALFVEVPGDKVTASVVVEGDGVHDGGSHGGGGDHGEVHANFFDDFDVVVNAERREEDDGGIKEVVFEAEDHFQVGLFAVGKAEEAKVDVAVFGGVVEAVKEGCVKFSGMEACDEGYIDAFSESCRGVHVAEWVVQLLGALENFLFVFGADGAGTGEGPRDGGDRKTGVFGDIF